MDTYCGHLESGGAVRTWAQHVKTTRLKTYLEFVDHEIQVLRLLGVQDDSQADDILSLES